MMVPFSGLAWHLEHDFASQSTCLLGVSFTMTDQQHVCPLQALWLEVLQELLQATTTTQAQVPPVAQQAALALAMAAATLAVALATLAMATLVLTPLAQKAPQRPRPRATSQALLRTKPPRAAAAAGMAARPMSQGTTAAATPQPLGFQEQQGPQAQLGLVSALAGLMPLAMSRRRSKAAQCTMLMVLQSAGTAAMVATPALPWAGQAPPPALAVAALGTAVALQAPAVAVA